MLGGLALSFAFSLCARAAQAPFQSYASGSSYDHGLFTPLESLAHVSDQEFTMLGHPFFPKHNVRIKQTNFCDSTVKCVVVFSVEFC